MASTDHHSSDSWTWAAMEPEPTDRERALYDTFCSEYLVDYNPTLAAGRCGFQGAFAEECGKRIMLSSYVRRRIKALESVRLDPKAEIEHDATLIKAKLRSIINDDSMRPAARVAAAGRLMEVHGIGAAAKSSGKSTTNGGVMLVPVGTMEEWERAAQASQQALIEASRVD